MPMFSFTQFQILTTLLALEDALKVEGAPHGHQGGKGLGQYIEIQRSHPPMIMPKLFARQGSHLKRIL